MNYQFVEKPNRLIQLEAIVPRLKQSHPNFHELNIQLGKDLAGYVGEKNLRYYFEFIQAEKVIHLAGLRLRGSTYYTQIDHLIATPHIIFIIEVKNRKGIIAQNQHGQYVQQYQQTSVTFDNPKHQADIQKRQLDYILRHHGFSRIPIIPIVAFPHNSVQLDVSITSKEVMVAQEVPFFINDCLVNNRQLYYNDHQLQQLEKLLRSLHEPRKVDLIKDYNIKLEDLNTGVLCSLCRNIFMQRQYATWTCSKCENSDSTAHHHALRDYTHLFSPIINNRTARWWLGLSCYSLTYRLLSEFPVIKPSGRKAVQYNLSSLNKIDKSS